MQGQNNLNNMFLKLCLHKFESFPPLFPVSLTRPRENMRKFIMINWNNLNLYVMWAQWEDCVFSFFFSSQCFYLFILYFYSLPLCTATVMDRHGRSLITPLTCRANVTSTYFCIVQYMLFRFFFTKRRLERYENLKMGTEGVVLHTYSTNSPFPFCVLFCMLVIFESLSFGHRRSRVTPR